MAGALAQRDAALARAQEIAADRQAMVDQFKVLSTETPSGRASGRRLTAQRLQATEQLLAPGRGRLEQFHARLTEVEKERVAIAADLRSQVQTVQQTGEQLRRETAALVTALRKPQVRGAWGELQLKRVVELAGMVEHCDFVLQHTATADGRVMRPDMRVNLAEGKFVYVDAKVPLRAFLDAQETDDSSREAAMATFAQNVRTHVDQLCGKRYWQAERARRSSSCCSCPARRWPPRRSSRCRTCTSTPPARRGAGHPDHADRAAARGGVRLEAGRAGRERRRGAPARPRAPRSAGHPRQPVRQARSRGPRLGDRLQRDRRHRGGHGCWSRPGGSPT